MRKVLSGVTIVIQAAHVRFELPAGGLDGAAPVKTSAGVGGGGACDAVGVMLPSLTVSEVECLKVFPVCFSEYGSVSRR